MRNPPSCQLQTSEGDGEEGKEGTGEEGVWIRRFTPTDLHLPRRRRLSRPPPAAARTALPAGAAAAPRPRPRPRRLHRRPRLSHPAAAERARKQDAASGYVSASPPPAPRPAPAATRDRRQRNEEAAAAGRARSPLKRVRRRRLGEPSSWSPGAFCQTERRESGSARAPPWTLHDRVSEEVISRARFLFPGRRMSRRLRHVGASLPHPLAHLATLRALSPRWLAAGGLPSTAFSFWVASTVRPGLCVPLHQLLLSSQGQSTPSPPPPANGLLPHCNFHCDSTPTFHLPRVGELQRTCVFPAALQYTKPGDLKHTRGT